LNNFAQVIFSPNDAIKKSSALNFQNILFFETPHRRRRRCDRIF